MPSKPATAKKPKLTDAERHKRFVETAREIGADESPDAFDRVFKKIVGPAPKRGRQ
jgi:hypothetical protein